MRSRSKARFAATLGFFALVLAFASCSTGPAPPEQGSPAWHWDNAIKMWEAGDLEKTSDNLAAIIEAGGEFADRAQPWRLIVTGGMASGYMDIADAFENGGRANQAASAEFRRQMNTYRSMASTQIGEFYETLAEFRKSNPAGPIPLAFSYPQGSVAPVPELARIGEGMMISAAEIASAQRRALQREVLMTTCVAAVGEEDAAKTQQLFASGNATVPKDTFVLAMAEKTNQIAGYYGPYKMDQPERVKLFNELALELVKSVPESDETKELVGKIEKEIKAAEKR